MELKDPFLELSKLRERIGADYPNKSFGKPLDPIEEIIIELEEGEIDVEREQIISHGPFLLYEGKF